METIASCVKYQSLLLKIIPTQKCNFRCATCHEDLSIGHMSKKVVDEIKNFINLHLLDIKYLSVEWLGGEPLIETDIIHDISGHILKEIKGRDIHYISGITTDGLQLNMNTFKKLLSQGVKNYQVILGRSIAKVNHRIKGSGSFVQIWNNILSMKEVEDDFKITINIPVRSENRHESMEFCTIVREGLSNDQRFVVLLKEVESFGETNSEYLTKDFPPLTEPYIHYPLNPNNIVIRANGVITQGTVEFLNGQSEFEQIVEDNEIIESEEQVDSWTKKIKAAVDLCHNVNI